MNNKFELIKQIELNWKENSRWDGILRPYSAEEVVKLKGSIKIDYSLAKLGAEKFWNQLQNRADEIIFPESTLPDMHI